MKVSSRVFKFYRRRSWSAFCLGVVVLLIAPACRLVAAPAAVTPNPQAIADALAKTGPEKLVAAVDETLKKPSTHGAERAAERAVSALARNGQAGLARDAVSHWSSSPGSDHLDNAPFEIAARTLVEKSPADALAWLETLPLSENREFARGTIAAEWAETEPAAAMAWAEKLPSGPVRTDVVQRVFNRWSDRDLEASMQWLHARVPDPALDQLIWYLATDSTLRYVQRDKALECAPWISDSNRRSLAIEHIVMIWAHREPEAARQFVSASSALDAAQKKRVLGRIGGSNTKNPADRGE